MTRSALLLLWPSPSLSLSHPLSPLLWLGLPPTSIWCLLQPMLWSPRSSPPPLPFPSALRPPTPFDKPQKFPPPFDSWSPRLYFPLPHAGPIALPPRGPSPPWQERKFIFSPCPFTLQLFLLAGAIGTKCLHKYGTENLSPQAAWLPNQVRYCEAKESP